MAIKFQAMESEHQIRPIDRSAASASISDSAEQTQQGRVEEAIGGGGQKSNAGAEAATAASDYDRMAPPPGLDMERPEGYDPLRIPLSIFETSKSAAPAEWSVASNESLFSIHVGSCSFSAEAGALVDELAKPEELGVDEGFEERQSFEDGWRLSAGVSKPALLSLSSSHSLLSEGSECSALSFAFPILSENIYKNESVKSGSDVIKRHRSSAATTSKPNSRTNKWFWCLPCTTCSSFSWCSWPRNFRRCSCNFRRYSFCLYCCC